MGLAPYGGPGIDLERYPGLKWALFGQLAAADGQPLPRLKPIKPQAANCQRSQRFCTSFWRTGLNEFLEWNG